MLFRANTTRPGIPRALAGADFISDGNYQNGAVLMGPSSFMLGKSAFPALFSRGVISFWTNYDSTASASGDVALIGQTFVASSLNSTFLTSCSFQGSSITATPFPLGCVAIIMNPSNMTLYLRDGLTGANLLGAAVNYVNSSNVVFNSEWVDLGPMSGATRFPFSFNGNSYTVPPFGTRFAGIPFPCGGGLAIETGDISSLPQACTFPNAGSLPTPGVFPYLINSVVTVGPTTNNFVALADFQGDVWFVNSSGSGGNTPTTGWHHYIWSWDTSQTVIDVNGNECIRCQCAIDRGGGPVQGGALYDTGATVATSISQPMLFVLEAIGQTGVLVTDPRNNQIDSDAWTIRAPQDASCKWAYMYFGIPRNQFFDLTASRAQGGSNLDYFITPGLVPQNWGFQADKVTPIAPQWIHTGAADSLTAANVPYFQINNAASPFKFNGDFNPDSIWIESGLPLVTSSDAPPLPSI